MDFGRLTALELAYPKFNRSTDIFYNTVWSSGVLFGTGQPDFLEFCRAGELRKTAEKRSLFEGIKKHSDIFRNCRPLVSGIIAVDGIRPEFEHTSEKLDTVMFSVSVNGSHCIGGNGVAGDIPLSRHIESNHGIIWS